MSNSKKQQRMQKTSLTKPSNIIYENPIMMPEITNISAGKNYLTLRFGYKKHDKSFVINSSIGLTYEQARELVNQINDAINSYEEYTNGLIK
jgi:hypothetical protein